MSQIPLITPPGPESREPSRFGSRRRTGRRRRLGFRSPAQGESMQWLTGGALVTCLLMTGCLFLYVLAEGLSTFWPRPVLRMTLADGSVVLGQVTRRESFPLGESQIQRLPRAERPAARAWLAGRGQAEAERWLIRTGNYERTDAHYQWVNRFAVAQQSWPRWAVLIERVEWGRFYGEPTAFVVRYDRPASAEELELRRIWELLTSGITRVDAVEQARIRRLWEESAHPPEVLRQQWRDHRSQSLVQFLRELPDVQGSTAYELEPGGDGPVSLDELRRTALAGRDVHPEIELDTIYRVTRSAAASWEAFQAAHLSVRQRYRQRQWLEKNEMVRANRRMEAARKSLREAELREGVSALAAADELLQVELQLQALEDDQARYRQAVTAVRQRFPEDHALLEAVQILDAGMEARISREAVESLTRRAQLRAVLSRLPSSVQPVVDQYFSVHQSSAAELRLLRRRIEVLQDENARYRLRLRAASGDDVDIQVADIVRAFPANQLTASAKLGVYLSRWSEFLTDDPREANSEGGVFPAIWGTVAMTLIMCLVVVPFGVLAALYLREYARAGWVVSAVRISINNLAGVPSIVFGVFGLGFFCYSLGAFVDGGPLNAGWSAWPPVRWFLLLGVLGLLALVAFVGTLCRESWAGRRTSLWRRTLAAAAAPLWLASSGLVLALVVSSPYFNGWYAGNLPNPTFGTGGLLWASLTLALLTLPVVIVATEEALAAVPNSLREGSYAAGATKWQTVRRIVLPQATPGILTGMILAMARGAGEVAPLMLVGAVKSAAELPVDSEFPYLHLSRSFMHLGLHVYDLGFQSQNSESAKPLVFTTTLLLIFIILTLNLLAIFLRSRLHRRFHAEQY